MGHSVIVLNTADYVGLTPEYSNMAQT